MPKELPRPQGAPPEPDPAVAPAPRRRRDPRKANEISIRREEAHEREARRVLQNRDGKPHVRFNEEDYSGGDYDPDSMDAPWLHRENPEIWDGSICEDG